MESHEVVSWHDLSKRILMNYKQENPNTSTVGVERFLAEAYLKLMLGKWNL